MNENRTDEAACCAAEDCQTNIVGTSVYIGNHVTDRGIDVYDDIIQDVDEGKEENMARKSPPTPFKIKNIKYQK